MREMKDSGIEWVGDIPSSWDIHPLYCFFGERKTKNKALQEQNLLSLSYGNIIRKDIDTVGGLLPASFNTYNIVEAGDIIIRPTDLQNDKRSLRTGLVLEKGIITSAYIDLMPYPGVNSAYYHYLLHAFDNMKVFYNMGNGVRQGLNYDEFSKLIVLEPSEDEQVRIVKYLDSKCAEINVLSADIKSEIETLEAYKRSVITEAITKGLNLETEMKDSGIEWVGNIPLNWQIEKGKYCLKYLQKPTKPDDDVITCFRDGEVTLRKNRREEGFTISLQEIGYQGIDKGDLIVHGMDGFAGAIGISDSRGKASPVLNVLDTKHNKRYIMYYLRHMAYNGVFLALATGIRVRTCDTNWGKLRELPYILPSKEEQECIVDFIDRRLFEVDSLIDEKRKQLEILDEYKKSLIYEYVTGKKEVPTT